VLVHGTAAAAAAMTRVVHARAADGGGHTQSGASQVHHMLVRVVISKPVYV
jgi:hypothetical protein